MVHTPHRDQVIVVFDGVCRLCNRFVDVLLCLDRRERLLFAPMGGATAAGLAPGAGGAPPGSVILVDRSGASRESTAVVRVLWHLGGPWGAVGWCVWLVPRSLRDRAYRFVARHRSRVFGAQPRCRAPTRSEIGRFLA